MRRRRGAACPRLSHLTLLVVLSVALAAAVWVAAAAAALGTYSH